MKEHNQNKSNGATGRVNRCGLAPDFWHEFSQVVWEKETFVKASKFITPPISEGDLYRCVVDMCDEHRDIYSRLGERDSRVRIYIAGIEQESNYFHILPNVKDKNFETYSRRVSRELGGIAFALTIDCISMPVELKAWTHDFLKGMYQPIRKISRGHFWSIFFGDYLTTPYGVHDHSNNVLSEFESGIYFPIRGMKKMEIWHPFYVNLHPEIKGSHNYKEHKEASTTLTAEPGGMIYWPSDRWHIGSSASGEVSIVLAVKVSKNVYASFIDEYFMSDLFSSYTHSACRTIICEIIERLLYRIHIFFLSHSTRLRKSQISELHFDPNDLQGSAAVIPDAIRKIGKRSNIRLLFGRNVERALTAFWLIHLTTLGVLSFNKPDVEINYSQNLRIVRNPGVPIIWRQVDATTIIVAADRYCHEISILFLTLIKYIANVEEGRELCVDKLMHLIEKQQTCFGNIQAIRNNLLIFLGRSGAFRVARK
jgi:hypothetical protein